MQHDRLVDRIAPADAAPRDLDLGVFPGAWINSNPDAVGFARIVFEVADEALRCRVEAIGPEGPIDWGWAEDVEVYAAGPGGDRALGFSARYDFGFLEVQIQANLNKGLMVLATYNRFHDDSGRGDYFLREYFAATHDRFGR